MGGVSSLTAYKETIKEKEDFFILKTEILKSDSSMYPGYTERPYNPDVISKKKSSLAIYDEMRRDDQVKAVLSLKKHMTLSHGWTVEGREEDEEIIGELTRNLNEIESPDFTTALMNILTHLDYGFSISEPIFDVQNGTIRLGKLKTRAPHTFILHTDDSGNLTEIEQYASAEMIKIKPDGLMVLQHQSEFGVPYGISDLQAAYRAWFSKDIVIKFWNIYLERFGNPLIVGKISANTSAPDKAKLLDALKNLQSKSGLVVPEGVDVEIKASSTGATDFEKAVNMYNMMIARSMLMPDLIGLGGSEVSGGSYSLGQKQFDVFFLTIEKIRQDLERAINRCIIRPLLWWNHGVKETADAPVWKLGEIDKDDKIEMLRLWSEAVRGNIWQATDEEINHFRNIVRFPKGEIVRPAQKATLLPFKKTERAISKKVDYGKRTLTPAERRVDFGAINTELSRLMNAGINKLIAPLVSIREGLIDTVQAGRLVDGKKIDKLPDLKLKYLKDLQLAWKAVLRDTFDRGWSMAGAEVGDKIAKMAASVSPSVLFEETIAERSFFITGIMRDAIRKEAGLIILRGIESGASTKETVHQLSDYFAKNYTPAVAGAGETYRIENIPGRLETITRTNVMKAYNQGRMNFFEQEVDKDFIQGYQFSAILDDRTTPLCERLDGEMYRAGDPYLDKINPPLHFNCRSLLVPVTVEDDFEASKQVVKDDELESFTGLL